jgi:hypothetical protein
MLNFDLIEPAVLTGFIRELPAPAQYTLNTWLPDRNIQDIEAAFTTAFRRNRAAMFRAFDAETPIGQREDFQRQRVALPPIGQKTLVGEEERLRLEMLRSGGDNTAALIQALYNDAQINTNAVLARMELARGQVLSTGKFSLSGENGLQGIEADFGVAGSHLPTASVSWTTYATSDPLANMRDWADLYTDDSGERPAYALTSRQAIGNMLRSASILAQFTNSNGGTPSVITRAQLAALLDANDLPQLVEYNTQVYTYAGVSTRVIPVNKMIYLPQDPSTLGNTFWGITAEAMELVGMNNPQLTFAQAPGLVGTVTRSGDPVRTWTHVAAIGMPVLAAPERLLAATLW